MLLTITDGVQFVIEQGRCNWLVDAIASYQGTARVKLEEFQHWRLVVGQDSSAVLTMTDGNSDTPIVRQEIEFTDYPEEEVQFYLIRTPGQPAVLLLPIEY